jgi:hypothetical protein
MTRRLILAYVAIGLLVACVLIGLVVLLSASDQQAGDPHIDLDTGSTNGIAPDDRAGIAPDPLSLHTLRQAAMRGSCVLRLHLKDEGHKHFPGSAPPPRYRTNPATSGDHIEEPFQQADGAYTESPPEEAVVHALEHGRLAIQYNPHLANSPQLELVGLYGTMYGATLLFPNKSMPYEVAAVTWTNLLGCADYRGALTLDAIRLFGRKTWGRYGGEPVRTFDASAPTPFEPRE